MKPKKDPGQPPSPGSTPKSPDQSAERPPPPAAGGTKQKRRSVKSEPGKAAAQKPPTPRRRAKLVGSRKKSSDDAESESTDAAEPSSMSLDRKRTLLAASAAATLAVFGVVLLASYLKAGEEERALSDPVASRQVLVVREAIPSGTTLDELVTTRATSVASDFVPLDYIAQGSLATIEELELLGDVMLEVDLQPGEQVLAARFVPTESFFNRVASVEIPGGHHQVSFSLDPTRSLGGLIRPGDDISIVASFTARAGFDDLTSVILPSVEVTNVQSSEVLNAPSTDDANAVATTPTGNYLITVAVEPDELTRLSFAIDYGRIMVAAAIDPEDLPEDDTALPTDVQTLEGVLAAAAEDLRTQRTDRLAFVGGDASDGAETGTVPQASANVSGAEGGASQATASEAAVGDTLADAATDVDDSTATDAPPADETSAGEVGE